MGRPFYHRLSHECIYICAYSSVFVRYRLLTVHLAYSLIELSEKQYRKEHANNFDMQLIHMLLKDPAVPKVTCNCVKSNLSHC